ncbi:hypothetical protein AVEN_101225-1 [Araneus ventricosus]|uniref:Uncharacterized protein n=1 Tax=Araneus ventricosus TaxID=182803 RepID=A0A4Y2FUT4_ARAVE|nr:hypothetical protein AVEN_101225-1 [Araneus ventricosus]
MAHNGHKIEKLDVNQINSSHCATQNLKTNSVNGSQEILGPITLHPDKILDQITFNQILLPGKISGKITITKLLPLGKLSDLFSNANTHFQDKLPPSPCWLCTKQGIANAYHWVQTCPFGFSAGQLPSPNPAPPNFDPPKEENQQ